MNKLGLDCGTTPVITGSILGKLDADVLRSWNADMPTPESTSRLSVWCEHRARTDPKLRRFNISQSTSWHGKRHGYGYMGTR
ncbi:hypothetical protein J6590_039722 [Homalodisca vitripennis]|nr:hypothetical protein J6590_039722 [Homalodisca vitripennis]